MIIFEMLQTNATTDIVYLYMTSINTIEQRRRCIKQINQKKLPGYDD